MFNIIWVPATLHLGISFALHFWPLIFFVWDESIDWRHHRSTGVSSEARPELGVSAQWDGATRPVQEQHLRSGERPLPRPVLLRQWIPVQLRGSLNLEEGEKWWLFVVQECEAYDSNNGPALMREMASDTVPVQPGVTFSTKNQCEVRQSLMWRNVNQGRVTFSQCQSFSW